MTAQTLINSFRTEIKDDEAPYRISDSVALRFLNEALLETRRLRVDAFWASSTVAFAPVTATLLTDSLSLLPALSESIVYCMAYRMLGMDSEHPGNAAMSANYYARYKAGVTA